MPRERGAADAELPETTYPDIVVDNSSFVERLDWARVFDHSGPVHIDIGCGKGRFLMARAAAQPEVNYLGVDRMQMRFTKLAGKIGEQALTNAKLLRMEAGYAMEHMLPEASIACFFILFPDPWPKQKHHRRRLVQASFVTVLHSKLAPGGIIQFASDHKDYYDRVKLLLADDQRFEEVEAMVPTAAERTDFERYYVSIEKPIGRCAYRKR